ncbi:MAG: amidohydrolase, partial [Planctomycetota bacterium]
VGDNEKIRRLQHASTRIYDLKGRMILPGLIDSHAHMLSLGLQDTILKLKELSKEDILALVKKTAEDTRKGKWIVGRGWDQNIWPGRRFPSRADLDGIVPDHPVFLERVDGHAAWVNTAALRLAGIGPATKDPEGGRIHRSVEGRANGILVDNAMPLVEKLIPPPDRQVKRESILRSVRKCLAKGVTMVHDAGIDAETASIYRELIEEDSFPFRVYAMIGWDDEGRDELLEQGPVLAHKDRLWIRSVKFYADGALGSRGAALLEAYSDDPGNHGILTMKEKDLEEMVAKVVGMGFQPCVHSIGDASARMLLDIYERQMKANPGTDMRPRVEHAQVVALDDIPRFGRLGVVASMQPIHCTSDMGWAEDRLGPERAHGAYAWRRLLDMGALVCSGTDFPVEPINPFYNLHAAVTRQDRKGRPQGGWYPENKMTLEEAMESYTLSGARAAFLEADLGSIEPGKFADFVVIDGDIRATPKDELHMLSVLMTVVGGEIVYERP